MVVLFIRVGSAVFGFFAVFFLIEAIWHFILCDYIRYYKKRLFNIDIKEELAIYELFQQKIRRI